MLNLTESYALRALCLISRHKKYIACKRIAAELEVPRLYLEQVLKSLARRGVLVGKRGRNGGYRLAREKSWTLVRHALGKQGNRCLLGAARCTGHRRCSFSHVCRQANRQLEKTTIFLHASWYQKHQSKGVDRE